MLDRRSVYRRIGTTGSVLAGVPRSSSRRLGCTAIATMESCRPKPYNGRTSLRWPLRPRDASCPRLSPQRIPTTPANRSGAFR